MDTIKHKCILCLLYTHKSKSVSSEDFDNIIIEEKLKYVLPDDNITSFYHKIVNYKPLTPKNICTECLQELNYVYRFKKKCFKNLKHLSESIDLLEQGHSLLKQELLKPAKQFNIEVKQELLNPAKQFNIEVENVVVKDEPEESEEENDIIEVETKLEEIVVKGEPIDSLHNEIDIKEDPLSVDESYSDDIIYNGTTSYSSCPEDPTRPYKCPICHKRFKTGKYLSTHKLIHSGEKPFTCDVCEKKFRNRYHLISHKYVHTGGEKPFKCPLCNMGFLSKSHLTVHERVHTGIKPYKCEVCDKAFSQRNILKTHLRTHSGIKPYECDVCEKAFAHKKTLRAHKRTHVVYKGYEGSS